MSAADVASEKLISSSAKGDLESIKSLVNNGAAVNFENGYGDTALMEAAGHGHVDCLDWLMSNGLEVNHSNRFDVTALQAAAEFRQVDCVKVLLENGASTQEFHKICQGIALQEVVLYCEIDHEVLHSLDLPIPEEIRSCFAFDNELDMLRCLLENSVSVNYQDYFQETALHLVAQAGHLAMARMLLQNGALVNLANSFGETPLILSAHKGNAQMVKLLLANGANANSRDKRGKTAPQDCSGQDMSLFKRSSACRMFEIASQ